MNLCLHRTWSICSSEPMALYAVLNSSCMHAHTTAHTMRCAALSSGLNLSLCLIYTSCMQVNFDDHRFHEFIAESLKLQAQLQAKMDKAGVPPCPIPDCPELWGTMPHPLLWKIDVSKTTVAHLIELSKATSINVRKESLGETLAGLQELVVYGECMLSVSDPVK